MINLHFIGIEEHGDYEWHISRFRGDAEYISCRASADRCRCPDIVP